MSQHLGQIFCNVYFLINQISVNTTKNKKHSLITFIQNVHSHIFFEVFGILFFWFFEYSMESSITFFCGEAMVLSKLIVYCNDFFSFLIYSSSSRRSATDAIDNHIFIICCNRHLVKELFFVHIHILFLYKFCFMTQNLCNKETFFATKKHFTFAAIA